MNKKFKYIIASLIFISLSGIIINIFFSNILFFNILLYIILIFSSGILLFNNKKDNITIDYNNEIKYKNITDNSPDIIIKLDNINRIIYANKLINKILNDVENGDSVYGKNILETKLNNIIPKYWIDEIEHIKTTGKSTEIIVPIKAKDYSYIFDCRYIPEFDENGKVISTIIFLRDITTEKNFEIELIKAKEKAEESDRLKSAFLANMSHEIRTPMNGILGFCSLLKRNNLDEEKRIQFIEIIESSGMQLLSTINDIIEIAKIESNLATINKIETNLNTILDDLFQIFHNQIKAKKLEFKLFKPLLDNDAYIYTDEIKIKQILSNLVSNAIKFTEKGSIEIGYEINNRILFYVKDTGIGISSAHYEIIFEHFRQIDFSDKRKYGGTGLGLTIAKALVELLGGEIWLDSELGKGTTFYFTVPYQQSKKISLNTDYSIQKDLNTLLSGKTILVAEDEETNYLFLKELFSNSKCHILWAKNGYDTIQLCEKYPNINLILMDIKMPEMDGFKATNILKNLYPDLPIIAVTAYAMPEDKEKALKAGCDGYISKPISKKMLVENIAKVL
jgi:signal transduction histidine kinase